MFELLPCDVGYRVAATIKGTDWAGRDAVVLAREDEPGQWVVDEVDRTELLALLAEEDAFPELREALARGGPAGVVWVALVTLDGACRFAEIGRLSSRPSITVNAIGGQA